ncbi:MAG: type pilus assembly protein PilQ [Phycisphaerales bacterium]|jgi:type IV pilus assembly protein PilQ|nr:type pilus assembly protein PilQ [Phycisphaerales bacterium]
MRKWTKTAGLLFLAAASVYTSRVIVAATESKAILPAASDTANIAFAAVTAPGHKATERLIAAPAEATEVKLLDEATDPFAAGAAGATTHPAAATTAPADGSVATNDGATAAPTSQPSEGRSVSSSEVSVSDAGTVEIHVNDANLVEVLRMLSLQSQKNIVASKDVHGTVTANLYDVTVREALDAILHANGYAYREKGNFIYVYTTKEIAEIEKNERQMKTEVFRVYYTPAANAANMIKPVLSKGGGEVAITTQSKSGIGSAPAGGGGTDHASDEMIVVTDYPENIDAARRILADVDRRPQQILLEATILRATLNEDNALGVDFNILGGVDFNSLGASETTGLIGNAGVKPVSPPGGGDAVIPTDGSRVHTAGTGQSFSGPIANGLKVGVVSSSVSVFVAALEQLTDTTIMANPKVLALNRQQGEVFVGKEDGYYTTVTTETTTSQSVESLKTGTRLIFRPYVASDGFIRMEVHPEDSDGQVNANGLPSKTTTEVTSNVMVKDGHTIVIGGLFRESTVSAKSQVPFVGNLPLVGMLFKNQRDRTVREEVIILLTPHIVKDDAAYSRMSEAELRVAEQLRVGTRKGLMPWGRERMAEGWYESAKKELNKTNPDRSLAKWHLDAATNLNPKFVEAIQLREQLTGQELTAADGTSVRSFVRRAILNDVAPATQPTTAPVLRAEADKSTTPATQPGEATADATTQPSGEATAETPTTQPAEEISVEAPMEEVISVPAPTEEPTSSTTEENSSASTPLAEDGAKTESQSSDNSAAGNTDSAPATESTEESKTEAAQGESSEGGSAITVTPLDEQPGANQQSE